MTVDIKQSREYNLKSIKDIKLSEKTKAIYSNKYDRVDVIFTGLDKIIIKGTTVKK